MMASIDEEKKAALEEELELEKVERQEIIQEEATAKTQELEKQKQEEEQRKK